MTPITKEARAELRAPDCPLKARGLHEDRTLDDYYAAVSGNGPEAYNWADKPHRLLYDMIAYALHLEGALDAAEAENERLRGVVDEGEARFAHLADTAAMQYEAHVIALGEHADARRVAEATIARLTAEVTDKERNAAIQRIGMKARSYVASAPRPFS